MAKSKKVKVKRPDLNQLRAELEDMRARRDSMRITQDSLEVCLRDVYHHIGTIEAAIRNEIDALMNYGT